MNYSQLLSEADQADIEYPVVLRNATYYVLRRDKYTGYSYLGFLFVKNKRLTYANLGFKLVTSASMNSRALYFLSKEDAQDFANYYDLDFSPALGRGLGGKKVVRIDISSSIPVYTSVDAIDVQKSPAYVIDRLAADEVVSDTYLAKKNKDENRDKKAEAIMENFRNALIEIDPSAEIDEQWSSAYLHITIANKRLPIKLRFNNKPDGVIKFLECDVYSTTEAYPNIDSADLAALFNQSASYIDGYTNPGDRMNVTLHPDLFSTRWLAYFRYQKLPNITSKTTKDDIKKRLESYISRVAQIIENVVDSEVI